MPIKDLYIATLKIQHFYIFPHIIFPWCLWLSEKKFYFFVRP